MRDRIRLAGSLGTASCLMFGYMNRDESHTSNIWDEEREEVGEGMDEEEEEEEKEEEEGSSLPKRGLRDWK